MRILHFADAHIDMANYGRHDPASGLPLRVVDYLQSLDTIIQTAITEKVDLVLFAGDAYKDRSPAPTFQREWSRRIMRLSRAGIPTLLLVGNHDLSPALNRAHALDPFSTLEVPNVWVLDKPQLLTPADLNGLPLQVIALPWISRAGLVAYLNLNLTTPDEIYAQLETRLVEMVDNWLQECDPALPIVLTAHASVQGASFGGERTVMLGGDLVLSGALVRNPRLSYTALGHIHKAQDLNPGQQPPVIYPGSIERVDFGEAREDKFFVIVHLQAGQPTQVEWRKLENIRPFIDRYLELTSQEGVSHQIRAKLPPPEKLQGAITRLTLDYPREWESLIDESILQPYRDHAFEFHLVKRPQIAARIRLPENQGVESLPPLDLLDVYWRTLHLEDDERSQLRQLAEGVLAQAAPLDTPVD
ncbi:MAG: exonuclease SbcCD subunit D [Anaerolineales bacterium]